MLAFWVPALVSMFLATISTPFVIVALSRWRIVDIASERSSHSGMALRGVGLSTLAGVMAGGLTGFQLLDGPDFNFLAVIVATAILGAFLGAAEDFWGLSVRLRACLQVLIAVAAIMGLAALTSISWLWWIPALIFIAGYINVANFMDGVNGISGLHGLLCGAFYLCLGLLLETDWLIVVGGVIAGSFLVFLPWNLMRKGTFLGDTGSYLLGALVSTTAVATWMSGVNLIVAFAPTIIYCFDTGGTLFNRFVQGDTWHEAHRNHVYQKLTLEGFSHVGSSTFVGLCTALVAGAALLLLQPVTWLNAMTLLLMIGVCLGYWFSPSLVRKIGQRKTVRPIREADAG